MATQFPILDPSQVDEILDGKGLVLLDFWQATCPPCQALEPRLEAFTRRHRGEFAGYRVNIEADLDTPGRFGVMSLPTLVLLQDGTELGRRDGLIRDADLESLLAEPSDSRQPVV